LAWLVGGRCERCAAAARRCGSAEPSRRLVLCRPGFDFTSVPTSSSRFRWFEVFVLMAGEAVVGQQGGWRHPGLRLGGFSCLLPLAISPTSAGIDPKQPPACLLRAMAIVSSGAGPRWQFQANLPARPPQRRRRLLDPRGQSAPGRGSRGAAANRRPVCGAAAGLITSGQAELKEVLRHRRGRPPANRARPSTTCLLLRAPGLRQKPTMAR